LDPDPDPGFEISVNPDPGFAIIADPDVGLLSKKISVFLNEKVKKNFGFESQC